MESIQREILYLLGKQDNLIIFNILIEFNNMGKNVSNKNWKA